MKVVTWKEFQKLPSGTVFQKYQPDCFEDVLIKEENCGDSDFFYSDLNTLEIEDDETTECNSFEKLNSGKDVNKYFNSIGRDGIFDYNQLYAVWSKGDIKSLIEKLQNSLI